MKSASTLSAAVAILSGTTNAFWRMPCYQRTTLSRLDPIVDPGTASSHAHTIHGGSSKSILRSCLSWCIQRITHIVFLGKLRGS